MVRNWGKDFSFENVLENLRESLSKLEGIGIKVHERSRYERIVSEFERALVAKSGRARPEDLDWNLLAEGLCDARELRVILASKHVLDQCWLELQQITKGTDYPWKDLDTGPRDLQFQLFTTAVIAHSGFEVSLKEPDVVFVYKDHEYSVAAKRVKSLKNLEKRVREAKNQIIGSNHYGFVALGLSQIARQNTGALLVEKPDVLWEAGEKITNGLMQTELKAVLKKTQHPAVIGCLVSIMIPSFIANSFSIGFTSNFRSIYFAPLGHACFDTCEEICKQIHDPENI